MRCTEMEEMISLYIDDLLDEHTKEMMDDHLKECLKCRSEYETLMKHIHLCNELPMVDLPEGFENDLHESLLNVNKEKEMLNDEIKEEVIPLKKNKKFNWKVFSSIAAVFIILIISASTLSSMNMGTKEEISMDEAKEGSMLKIEDDGANYGMAQSRVFTAENSELRGTKNKNIEMFAGSPKINEVSEKQVRQLSERKIIKSAYIHLDIEDYDKKFNKIVNMAEVIGGYIENSNTEYSHYVPEEPEASLRRGNITIRVPEGNFINIVEEVKGLGKVTNFSINGEDITQMYRDTVNEVENLKIQEKRLREIMNKAESVKDVLEVERELTRVRGDLNRLTGNIKRWDQLVSLSKIEVSLNEVIPKDKKIQSVDDDLLDKAKKGFISTINGIKNFFEKSFIMLVSVLPIILLIGIIGVPLVRYFLKRIRNK
ncbi:DUF4349 domain-containing protein [Crassaminicella profunda]|uniref:DUF4349 domain-containing protein n=1 Tax=Crassaminicella profunda TaxID=1286698 RepID=UPI001CA7937C|nr:DUF4349 domain-containing protein [Crassaminicella profunda]QZY56577.1 DUF4349 domain-containing protein [Crassaminicella profunda]